MNLLVNTKSCFLTGWYEVRSNNPFGGTNRIRFTGIISARPLFTWGTPLFYDGKDMGKK